MVARESVFVRAIERQRADYAIDAFERHGQRRAQGTVLSRVVQISTLDRRVAVQNALSVRGYPTGESFAHGYLERGEQAVVLAVYKVGEQHLAPADIHGDGI